SPFSLWLASLWLAYLLLAYLAPACPWATCRRLEFLRLVFLYWRSRLLRPPRSRFPPDKTPRSNNPWPTPSGPEFWPPDKLRRTSPSGLRGRPCRRGARRSRLYFCFSDPARTSPSLVRRPESS